MNDGTGTTAGDEQRDSPVLRPATALAMLDLAERYWAAARMQQAGQERPEAVHAQG